MFNSLKKIDFYKKLLIEWNRLTIILTSFVLLMSSRYIFHIYRISEKEYLPNVFHIAFRTSSFQYAYYSLMIISIISFIFWSSTILRYFPRDRSLVVLICNLLGFLCFSIFTTFYPFGKLLFYQFLGILTLAICNFYYVKEWSLAFYPLFLAKNRKTLLLKITSLFTVLSIAVAYFMSTDYMITLTYPKSKDSYDKLVYELHDLPIVNIDSYFFQNVIILILFVSFFLYFISTFKLLIKSNAESIILCFILERLFYNFNNFYLLNPFQIVFIYVVLFINPKIYETIFEVYQFFKTKKKQNIILNPIESENIKNYVSKHKKILEFLVTLSLLFPLFQHYLKYDILGFSDFYIELVTLASSIFLLFYCLYIFKVILYTTGNHSSWLTRQLFPFFTPSIIKIKNNEFLFDFLSDYLISETLFVNIVAIYVTCFSILGESPQLNFYIQLFYTLCFLFAILLALHKFTNIRNKYFKIIPLLIISWLTDLVPYLIILYPMYLSDKLSDSQILVLMGCLLLFVFLLEIIDAIAHRKGEYFGINVKKAR